MKYAIERPAGQGIRLIRDDRVTFALIYRSPVYHLMEYVPYKSSSRMTICGHWLQDGVAPSGDIEPDKTCARCLLGILLGDEWKAYEL